ncbi:MAG TPA: hypothetical protein VIR04_03030, partial [Paralcaligenes sp.]
MTEPNLQPDKEIPATADSADAEWAAALSEQAAQNKQPTQADGLADAASVQADDWANALAEQTAAATMPAETSSASATPIPSTAAMAAQ